MIQTAAMKYGRAETALRRIYWACRRRLAFGPMRRHIVFRFAEECLLPHKVNADIVTINSVDELAAYDGISEICDLNFVVEELEQGARLKLVIAGRTAEAIALYGRPVNWYVPLGPTDEVIYSVVTSNRAKGRSLAGQIVQQIAGDITSRGGAAYLDCAVWNTRAHRAFEKAGFARLGTTAYPPMSNSVATD